MHKFQIQNCIIMRYILKKLIIIQKTIDYNLKNDDESLRSDRNNDKGIFLNLKINNRFKGVFLIKKSNRRVMMIRAFFRHED